MLVGPADALPDAPDPDDADFEAPDALTDAVAALDVSGNFMFDAATHRDFLGACLGTGIDRSKVCFMLQLLVGTTQHCRTGNLVLMPAMDLLPSCRHGA